MIFFKNTMGETELFESLNQLNHCLGSQIFDSDLEFGAFVNHLIQIGTSEQVHKSFDSDRDLGVHIMNLFFWFIFY